MILILLLTLILFCVAWLRYRREVIRNADGSPYIIRYFIWNPKDRSKSRIYLHHIMSSDNDRAVHDHPWSFRSIILWRGYIEYFENKNGRLINRFIRPIQIIKRPAKWRHRLDLIGNKPAWTLVFCGPKEREWGFWPAGKFCPWFNYEVGSGICEE